MHANWRLHSGLGLATISLLMGAPGILEACSCRPPGSADVERSRAEAVFLGVVTSVRDLDVAEGPRAFPLTLAYQFSVSRGWKGVSTSTIEVGTSALGPACAYSFEIGEEYLVYAGGSSINSATLLGLDERTVRRSGTSPTLWTTACSRTRRFHDAEGDDLPKLGTAVWVNTRLKESFLSEELLQACSLGDTLRVRALIASGQDVNGRDRHYDTTALKAAASGGHVETVKVLLAAGADVQATRGRTTALEDGIIGGYVAVVRTLLAAGARTAPDTLAIATSSGHGAVVDLLLASGVAARGEPGAQALLWAARKDDVSVVRRLLEAGADPARPLDPPAPQSVLDVAAAKGNVEMIRLLLGKGARPSRTTLDAAVQSGNREAVRMINEPLARLAGTVKPGPAALIRAAIESNLAGIDLALESGVDVNATDERGGTALLAAVSNSKPEAIRRLLKARADPNLPDNVGIRPLMRAAQNGHLEILKDLLDAGADVEAQQTWEGRDRGTALRFAVGSDRPETVALLLKAGAKPDSPGEGALSGSILAGAVMRGSLEIVRLLVRGGADVNARLTIGTGPFAPKGHLEDPPLSVAVDRGTPELVQLLLDAGARIDARDASGQTALERAERRQNQPVIALLRKAAAKP